MICRKRASAHSCIGIPIFIWERRYLLVNKSDVRSGRALNAVWKEVVSWRGFVPPKLWSLRLHFLNFLCVSHNLECNHRFFFTDSKNASFQLSFFPQFYNAIINPFLSHFQALWEGPKERCNYSVSEFTNSGITPFCFKTSEGEEAGEKLRFQGKL